MERSNIRNRWLVGGLFSVLALGALGFLSGCQMTQNGQTLPSPYYLDNQIQYFPAGNEFQFQGEVDRMKREQVNRQLSQEESLPRQQR
ncbi:MAG: hypothetical protein IJJ20_07800 [Thermoguttaceae bacterium]|nr:hypothetical protein [Thermoguttaceae bacterium]MBR6481511.1 hypothetical protein [Thermoguttaceae bacterium]